MQYHNQLSEAIAIEDINTISSIYNPIYSEWIDIELLAEMKPSTKLHELNIANRTPELKTIALQNWIDLSDAIIYDD